jgi:hypothetical protein
MPQQQQEQNLAKPGSVLPFYQAFAASAVAACTGEVRGIAQAKCLLTFAAEGTVCCALARLTHWIALWMPA